jgi:hypothetical protein
LRGRRRGACRGPRGLRGLSRGNVSRRFRLFRRGAGGRRFPGPLGFRGGALPLFRQGRGGGRDIDRRRRRNIAGGRSFRRLVPGREPGNEPGKVFLDSSLVYPEKAGDDDKKAPPEYHRRGDFSGTPGFFPRPRAGFFSPAGFSYCHIPMIRRNRRIRKGPLLGLDYF